MARVVVKIGGSVLKRPEDLIRVLDVLSAYDRPVVVVSAFYGVTDSLEQVVENGGKGGGRNQLIPTRLRERTLSFLRGGMTGDDLCCEAEREVEEILSSLERLLEESDNGRHSGGSDLVLSYGERLAAVVVAACLRGRGIDCQVALPERIGLQVRGGTGVSGGAVIDLERSRAAVRSGLVPETAYVVPGFYGLTMAGEVKLLDRGGSDYTGSALAACLDAESLDLWKDVDGVLTGDPRLVSQACTVAELTYGEAEELAFFGASVISVSAIGPLVRGRIPVRLFNLARGRGSAPCTIVSPESSAMSGAWPGVGTAKSIAVTDQIALLSLAGASLSSSDGLVLRVVTGLLGAGVQIKTFLTSQTRILVIVPVAQANVAEVQLRSAAGAACQEVTVRTDLSLLAVVGEMSDDSLGVVEKVLSAFAGSPVGGGVCHVGFSPVATFVCVKRRRARAAVRRLHEVLFSSGVGALTIGSDMGQGRLRRLSGSSRVS